MGGLGPADALPCSHALLPIGTGRFFALGSAPMGSCIANRTGRTQRRPSDAKVKLSFDATHGSYFWPPDQRAKKECSQGRAVLGVVALSLDVHSPRIAAARTVRRPAAAHHAASVTITMLQCRLGCAVRTRMRKKAVRLVETHTQKNPIFWSKGGAVLRCEIGVRAGAVRAVGRLGGASLSTRLAPANARSSSSFHIYIVAPRPCSIIIIIIVPITTTTHESSRLYHSVQAMHR